MLLKPFRIRNLYDSGHHGVVQISGPQYDSTVKSQPDATLTYLDEDDGETILVGSSFELQQRLDEPHPMHSAASIPTPPSQQEADNAMHTFDIQPSLVSLATWREHDAYSSKVLRRNPPTLPQVPACSGPLAPSPPPAPSAAPHQQDQPESLENAVAGALQGLESHVGTFADFLQTASTALRAGAKQAREADVSAVELVLDGFRGIIGEVGKVGKAMIKAFDAGASGPTQESVPVLTAEKAETDSTTKLDKVKAEETRQKANPSVSMDHSNGSLVRTIEGYSFIPNKPAPVVPPKEYTFAISPQLPDPRCNPEPAIPSTEQGPSQASCSAGDEAFKSKHTSLHPAPMAFSKHDQVFLPRETAKTFANIPRGASSKSILDLENSDPDFSVRYPPLMTLRKSRTLGSLNRQSSPFLANINPEAEISRFPSLSELEHEEMLQKAGHLRAQNSSFTRNRLNGDQQEICAAYSKHLDPPWSFAASPQKDRSENLPAPARPLPGAWPESRPEADGPTLPISEESSGAFFDRMTRNRSSNLPPTSRPEFCARPPLRLDTETIRLGRSKTTSASNPAARLTRPFDPLLEPLHHTRERTNLPRRSGTERHHRRPYTETFTGAGRVPWNSFESAPRPVREVATSSEPQLATGVKESYSGFGISPKVTKCVRQLRDMGYGNRSPHEASRLSVYAAACGGDVMDAVEMIEEDRKAGRQHRLIGDKLGVRPFSHNEAPTFGS